MSAETVVRLSGDIDMSNVDAAREQLALAVATARHGVIVDVSDVTYLDSTGIGALVQARSEAHRIGLSFELSGVSARIARVLQILGLTEDLPEVGTADGVADAAAT
jgi:anti-sigma B factor antagonist